MNKEFYIRLIKEGQKLENGNIRIVIPCHSLAIRSHNVGLSEFIKNSNYNLISSKFVGEFGKIIAYVKEEKVCHCDLCENPDNYNHI